MRDQSTTDRTAAQTEARRNARARRATLPPLGPRRERSAAETKRRILDSAEVEFAAKGFDGARLSNIARGAGVQQALIHHYFEDKERLHRAVLERALEAMTSGVWALVERMQATLSVADIRAIAEEFVAELLRFYAEHGPVLHIVRHEALRGDSAANQVVSQYLRPVFDAIVKRMEELRASGDLRADLDPRHLCISTVAMVSFPFQEEPFLASVWPVDCRSPEFVAKRQREITEMVLARVMP